MLEIQKKNIKKKSPIRQIIMFMFNLQPYIIYLIDDEHSSNSTFDK